MCAQKPLAGLFTVYVIVDSPPRDAVPFNLQHCVSVIACRLSAVLHAAAPAYLKTKVDRKICLKTQKNEIKFLKSITNVTI